VIKGVFFLLALPSVIRAAWRVRRLEPGCCLPELVDRLRQVKPWRFAFLNHPEYLEGSVGRLMALLPPGGRGPCMRRSLILLDLWSRCGLDLRFHLGMATGGDDRRFHAWVTSRQGSAHSGYVEIWSR
jgi:hypothetical protein